MARSSQLIVISDTQVTYKDPKSESTKTFRIPLQPDTSDLSPLDITMHQSPVTALAMPKKYADWFSSCFGYPVVLAYLGPDNYRPVLGNLAPNAATRNPVRRERQQIQQGKKNETSGASWISSFVNSMPALPTILSGGTNISEDDEGEDYQITFADCAPYLIASETSLSNISSRLPADQRMDITKFRPNIIVSGAESAFEEDFWAELSFSPSSPPATETKITLTANCVRCTSINVDYTTGAFGTGDGGNVLKTMQKDRRIDMGHKYSPVFGRYGFLGREERGGGGGRSVKVGDEVVVTRRNEENTVLKWPGIGNTPKEELYAL